MRFKYSGTFVAASLLSSFIFLVPLYTHAQNSASSTSNDAQVAELTKLIAILSQQLQQLLSQRHSTTSPTPTIHSSNTTAAQTYCFTYSKSLASGSHGQDVTNLQIYLSSQGVFSGPATGYFGPMTRRALLQWQTIHGIQTTGNLDPATGVAMVNSCSPIVHATSTTSTQDTREVSQTTTTTFTSAPTTLGSQSTSGSAGSTMTTTISTSTQTPASTSTQTSSLASNSPIISKVQDAGINANAHYISLFGTFPSHPVIHMSCGNTAIQTSLTYTAYNQINFSFADLTSPMQCTISVMNSDTNSGSQTVTIVISPHSIPPPVISKVSDAGISNGLHYFTLSGTFYDPTSPYKASLNCNGSNFVGTITYSAANQINVSVPQDPSMMDCMFTVQHVSDGTVSNSLEGTSTIVDLKQYWPQPDSNTVIINRFDSGRINFYRRSSNGYTLGDYWHNYTDDDTASTLLWADTWHYSVDPINGVVEFEDDYPNATSAPPFMSGYEIKWGNIAHIGDTVQNKVVYGGDTTLSPFGFQHALIYKFYPIITMNSVEYKNVLEIHDRQDVCTHDQLGAPGSANSMNDLGCPTTQTIGTYYMAPGLGIIRIDEVLIDGKPGPVENETIKKQCTVPSTGGGEYCK